MNTCRRCPSGACCQTPDRKNSSPAHQNHSSASIQIRQRNNMKDCVGSPVCVFSGCVSTRGSNIRGRVCEYTRTGPVQGTGLPATLQCSTFTREHPPTLLNCCTKIPGHTCRHCFLPTENASFKNLSLHKISILSRIRGFLYIETIEISKSLGFLMKNWVIPAQLRAHYQRLSYSEAYSQSVFLNNNEHTFTSLIKELLLCSELGFCVCVCINSILKGNKK